MGNTRTMNGPSEKERQVRSEALSPDNVPDSVADIKPGAGTVWPPWVYRLVLTLALGFIGVQLALPLTPFLVHSSEVRTDFSWDMFAVRRDCRECIIMGSRPGHSARRYGWGKLYKTTFQAARTRNKTRLPQAAREVCRREAAAGRSDAQVFVECNCRYNKGPLINLDPFGGDYCSPEAAKRFDGGP